MPEVTLNETVENSVPKAVATVEPSMEAKALYNAKALLLSLIVNAYEAGQMYQGAMITDLDADKQKRDNIRIYYTSYVEGILSGLTENGSGA
jgi:hypothetical protein